MSLPNLANPQGAPCLDGPDAVVLLSTEVRQLQQTVQEHSQLLKSHVAAIEDLRDMRREFSKQLQEIKQSLLSVQTLPFKTSGSLDGNTFAVRLVQTADCELGLELDENTLTVLEVDASGLVADWNRRNPLAAILPGSRILSVNGESGTDKVLRRLVQDRVLQVVLSRR